jgi:hypothetical protein
MQQTRSAQILTRNASSTSVGNDGIAPEDLAFETNLFVGSNQQSARRRSTIPASPPPTPATPKRSAEKYGEGYFRWNIGYTLTALVDLDHRLSRSPLRILGQ